MPDEVERKGFGTPATRAGVIEKLVRIGFVERQGNKKTNIWLLPIVNFSYYRYAGTDSVSIYDS